MIMTIYTIEINIHLYDHDPYTIEINIHLYDHDHIYHRNKYTSL